MTQTSNHTIPIQTPFHQQTPHNAASTTNWIVGATALGALAILVYAARKGATPQPSEPTPPPRQFTNEDLTATFVAAIPTITRELNLETATANQIETFTQSSAKSTLWGMVDLGTNTAQIRVPVTYRYHICLLDSWELKAQGQTLVVMAPVIRASLPPAINTDQVERMSVRGWCRGAPTDLLEHLERQVTPAISQRATDPKQLDLVRQTCRLSVAEFVRLWLERENQWHPGGFTAIQVRFGDELTLPAESTLRLPQ